MSTEELRSTVRDYVQSTLGESHAEVEDDLSLLRTMVKSYAEISGCDTMRGAVSEATGHGKIVSMAICEALGLDPEASIDEYLLDDDEEEDLDDDEDDPSEEE